MRPRRYFEGWQNYTDEQIKAEIIESKAAIKNPDPRFATPAHIKFQQTFIAVALEELASRGVTT